MQDKVKICRICEKEKLLSEYYSHHGTKDGLNTLCKACSNEATKTRRAVNMLRPHVGVPDFKVCSVCKEEKPKEDFSSNLGSLMGLSCDCRVCHRKRAKEYGDKNAARNFVEKPKNKRCHCCGLVKGKEGFYLASRTKDGLYFACKACCSHKNKEKLYGVSREMFAGMLDRQKGACVICGTHLPGGPGNCLMVDHDHKGGKVRGLLCCNCNHGLGKFQDSPDLLRKAAEYLEKHSEVNSNDLYNR